MKSDDLIAFQDLITETLTGYGRPVTPQVLNFWVKALRDYDLAGIRDAISEHIADPAEGRFAPMPAHIIGKIQIDDGHPSTEEAWAMCPISEDDAAVWTDVIRQAFFETAYPMLDRGETVSAARGAFMPAYKTALAKARAKGHPAKFEVTPGSRKSTFQAVQKAYESGWVSERWACRYLELNLPEFNLRLPPPPQEDQPRLGGGLRRIGGPALPARSADHA